MRPRLRVCLTSYSSPGTCRWPTEAFVRVAVRVRHPPPVSASTSVTKAPPNSLANTVDCGLCGQLFEFELYFVARPSQRGLWTSVVCPAEVARVRGTLFGFFRATRSASPAGRPKVSKKTGISMAAGYPAFAPRTALAAVMRPQTKMKANGALTRAIPPRSREKARNAPSRTKPAATVLSVCMRLLAVAGLSGVGPMSG